MALQQLARFVTFCHRALTALRDVRLYRLTLVIRHQSLDASPSEEKEHLKLPVIVVFRFYSTSHVTSRFFTS